MKVSEHKNEALYQIVARILSSFAARENASVAEILELARDLPNALESLEMPSGISDKPADQVQLHTREPKTPAVPIEQSVSKDQVTCLSCGRSFTMLKRHLKAEHGLTEDQYRERFGLTEEHPLTAPSYSERKAAYAKRIGLGKYSREEHSLSNADSTS